MYILFFSNTELFCLGIIYASEFLKGCEFSKAGPCLIYLGGHCVWHIVGTQYRFVELVKGTVRTQKSQKVPLIKEKRN